MNAFDVIIIGFGKGRKDPLRQSLQSVGQKVAIIERSDKMYGGTCINIGCIPTKTLVHQAKMASALKDATFEERSEFYRNAVSVKESVTSALRNKNYHNLADKPQCDRLYGHRFFCFRRMWLLSARLRKKYG